AKPRLVPPGRGRRGGRRGGGEAPEPELAPARRRPAPRARHERRISRDKDARAAEEDARARLVEAAFENGEGRNRERRQPPDGELAEDEEEAGAEVGHVRHPKGLLDEPTRGSKSRRATRRRPPPAG